MTRFRENIAFIEENVTGYTLSTSGRAIKLIDSIGVIACVSQKHTALTPRLETGHIINTNVCVSSKSTTERFVDTGSRG